MPTKQETFDTVVSHLRKQGKKAFECDVGCMYRSGDGLKCAAGCLIPDGMYTPRFEGGAIWTDDEDPDGVTACIRNLGHDIELVIELQNAHDSLIEHKWEERFHEIALMYGLTYTPV